MKLGIMQPYFFPYLGHFSLIAHTDEWIVFDITQYKPKSWMNRNRILHPKEGWNYVTVPLRNSSQSIKIYEAKILDVAAAHKSILGKMSHYSGRAPYFSYVKNLVNTVFLGCVDDSLVRLNVRGLETICNYLDIPFHYHICSEMDLPIPSNMLPGSWAPTISKLLGASQYINPIGGRELFNPEEFYLNGVELYFLDVPTFFYDTSPYGFESNLSILDVLMWNEPNKVKEALFRTNLVKA